MISCRSQTRIMYSMTCTSQIIVSGSSQLGKIIGFMMYMYIVDVCVFAYWLPLKVKAPD